MKMYFQAFMISLLLQVSFGLPSESVSSVKGCVEKALGSSAAKRIITPSDSTYTDARVGETIQYV
jgi:hypothetical protein